MPKLKAAEGFAFFVEHVKNGQQLCDRQQVLNFLRQFQELQRAAFFFDSGKTRHKLADAARIDIADACQIEQDLVFAFAEQAANCRSQCDAAFADRDLPARSRIVTSPAWRSVIVISDIIISSFSFLI